MNSAPLFSIDKDRNIFSFCREQLCDVAYVHMLIGCFYLKDTFIDFFQTPHSFKSHFKIKSCKCKVKKINNFSFIQSNYVKPLLKGIQDNNSVA